MNDISNHNVFLCYNLEHDAVGTVTIKKNEICRLFVLPQYQGNGHGRELVDYAETTIAKNYDEIILDASLSAKMSDCKGRALRKVQEKDSARVKGEAP